MTSTYAYYNLDPLAVWTAAGANRAGCLERGKLGCGGLPKDYV